VSSAAPTVALPPHAAPAEKPLRFPRNLFRLLSNNLSIIPEQAYHSNVVIAPGPPRMAFITGEKAVEEVLKDRAKEFPKGKLQNEVLDPLFGDAMISCEGEEWRWQRGLAAPMFRHDELLDYAPIMGEAAEATIAQWRADRSGRFRPVNRDMMHATFAVISRTMLVGGASEVIEAIEKGHSDYFRLVNWWVLYRAIGLPRWFPRPGAASMRAQEKRLREAVEELVEARRHDAAGGDDLLARLLAGVDPETGQQMEPERVVNNVIAFLVAGYDTTALALSWTLYLIATHPEWGDRIREEVRAVAGGGPIGPEHLEQLVILGQVLNESLRLYPTAPMVVRDILEDTELDGVPLRKGTLGFVPIYAIHRHRGFWRDPDAFDPTRFAPDAPKPSRYQFLPFGAGPRICLGASFAVIEAKLMLASFLRAARFELQPGFVPRPTGQMFLTANGDIPMRVTMVD
jgi:cytochrome P450